MSARARMTHGRSLAVRAGGRWGRALLAGACSLVVGLAGCSTGAEPRVPAARSTLRVENSQCWGTQCVTLGVAMYPRSWLSHVSDSSLAGVWLGYVQGPTACFSIPEIDTLTVVHRDSAGVVLDSAQYFWTPDDPNGVFLGVFALLLPIAASRSFVPARSEGWLMTVPDSVFFKGQIPVRARVTPDSACAPDS